jgi:tetratricopeptide (TPR) repeat protein
LRAIEDYSAALRIDAGSIAALTNRPQAYRRLGFHGKAITDYDRAVDLDPLNPTTYVKRGYAFFFRGDLDPAIADYDAALRIDPKNTSAILSRREALDEKRRRHQRGNCAAIWRDGCEDKAEPGNGRTPQ